MGSNPTPGTLDPVTGLSRRQLIALAMILPLGIAASTVATAVSENVDEACPDESYECAALKPGEPVIIGLVGASEPSLDWPLREAVEQGIGRTLIAGHAVLVDLRLPGCSAEEASQDVRELASDPSDEPPATVVVGAHCREAAVPMAQLLSDTGTTLVSLDDAGPVPTDPAYHLTAHRLDLSGDAAGVQGIGLASQLRDVIAGHLASVLEGVALAIERVAIEDGDDLLIPRTPLRDQLVRQGFSPAT